MSLTRVPKTKQDAAASRENHQKNLNTAIKRYEDVHGLSADKKALAERRIRAMSDNELHAISEAVIADPDSFTGSLLSDLFADVSLETLSTVAIIYSADIYPGRSRHFRNQAIRSAYIQYVGEDEVGFPGINPLSPLNRENVWKLASHSDATKDRARRWVAMICALEEKSAGSSFMVKDKLSQLMLDDARPDHDDIIAFLRSRAESELTPEQIDFLTSGGPVSISSGVL